MRSASHHMMFGVCHARAEAGPGGLGESWGVGLSVSEALDSSSSSSSSVCSALWYSMKAWVLWVIVMVQGPWAHGSPSTCMGILELLRTSWRGRNHQWWWFQRQPLHLFLWYILASWVQFGCHGNNYNTGCWYAKYRNEHSISSNFDCNYYIRLECHNVCYLQSSWIYVQKQEIGFTKTVTLTFANNQVRYSNTSEASSFQSFPCCSSCGCHGHSHNDAGAQQWQQSSPFQCHWSGVYSANNGGGSNNCSAFESTCTFLKVFFSLWPWNAV